MEEYPYKIIGWKIWYCDADLNESMFSSNDGTWEEAPDQNVQRVMAYFDLLDAQGRPRREVLDGSDYYWFNGKIFDAGDDITKATGPIKYGKEIDYDFFRGIQKKSLKDFSI